MRTWPTALSAAVAAAIIVSVAGPALDHHFAERLPYHAHVQLWGDLAHHSHEAHNPQSGAAADGVISIVDPSSTQIGGAGFALNAAPCNDDDALRPSTARFVRAASNDDAPPQHEFAPSPGPPRG